MRWSVIAILLVAGTCWSQTSSTGDADTSGPCSPAVTGSGNQFTINCPGISKQQGSELLMILNKVAKNQLDPKLVMAKLDEIQNGIKQLRDRDWVELTKAQIQSLCNALSTPNREHVTVLVPNEDGSRLLLANQVGEAFRCAKWDTDVVPIVTLFGANSQIPSGIEVLTRKDSPPAQTVVAALVGVFGQNAVRGFLSDQVVEGAIQIKVWYKPR